MSEDVDKDFVDRAIAAERRWIESELKSRDRAIELAASKIPHILSLIGVLIAAAAYFKGH